MLPKCYSRFRPRCFGKFGLKWSRWFVPFTIGSPVLCSCRNSATFERRNWPEARPTASRCDLRRVSRQFFWKFLARTLPRLPSWSQALDRERLPWKSSRRWRHRRCRLWSEERLLRKPESFSWRGTCRAGGSRRWRRRLWRWPAEGFEGLQKMCRSWTFLKNKISHSIVKRRTWCKA